MISKSEFLKYFQCYKYLWLYKFKKDLISGEISNQQQALFDEGYVFEDHVKKIFPNGFEIEGLYDEAVKNTKSAIEKGQKILFQATAKTKSLYAMADIFIYNDKTNKWNIYEVKSSTSVKDIHLIDLAFQKICFEEAGYEIGETNLVCANNKYIKKGKIDCKKLTSFNNITKDVKDLIKDVHFDIKKALELTKQKQEPDIKILKQCKSPYECPFISYCWKGFPEQNIYKIAGGLRIDKLEDLLERGILDIKEIPEDYLTSRRSILHHKVVKHEKTLIDRPKIIRELEKLKYPLYFIDYETYSPVIPMFDGYRPYQRIVFQFSLHVQEKPGDKLKHYEYLCQEEKDPTEELLKELKKHIKKPGTFISWNASFEMGCNREMADRAPKFQRFYNDINNSMFDLMQIFRKGYYVDRNFHGSASIKKVLPVLVPKLSYKDLNIQEGGTASESWAILTDKNIKKTAKDKLNKDMLKYCELDTLAMVEILKFLKKL
jgi:hypothetical protein